MTVKLCSKKLSQEGKLNLRKDLVLSNHRIFLCPTVMQANSSNFQVVLSRFSTLASLFVALQGLFVSILTVVGCELSIDAHTVNTRLYLCSNEIVVRRLYIAKLAFPFLNNIRAMLPPSLAIACHTHHTSHCWYPAIGRHSTFSGCLPSTKGLLTEIYFYKMVRIHMSDGPKM